MKPTSGKAPTLPILALLALVAITAFMLFGGGGSADGGSNSSELPALVKEEESADPIEVAQISKDGIPVATEERTTLSELGPLGSGVYGRVLDQGGNPISHATVILQERVPPSELMMRAAADVLAFRAETGIDGGYRFNDLPLEPNYVLHVTHADYAPKEAFAVRLLEDEVQELPDLVLGDGFRIFGRVSDEHGNPVPARVIAESQVFNPTPGMAEAMGRKRTTDVASDGSYALEHMTLGLWKVTVVSQGMASDMKPDVALYGEKREVEHNVVLKAEKVLAGLIVDELGNPVPEARIDVGRRQPRPPIEAHATSDDSGEFVVRGLQDGVYGLSVRCDGFSNGRIQRVKAGQTDLKVTLQARASVSGRVIDANTGAPIPEFTLDVRRVHRNTKVYGLMPGLSEHFKSPDGTYQLRGFDPGDYILLVHAAGYSSTYGPGFHIDRENVIGVDIPVKIGGMVTGTVVEAGTTRALPGVRVQLRSSEYKPTAGESILGLNVIDPSNLPVIVHTTQADGRFVMPNLPAGTYQLEFRHPTYLREFLSDVTVYEGGTTEAGTAELRAGAQVYGTVTKLDGTPAAGAQINLTQKDPGGGFGEWVMKQATADARGRFRITAVPAGYYDITATTASDSAGLFAALAQADQSKQEVYLSDGGKQEVNLVVGE